MTPDVARLRRSRLAWLANLVRPERMRVGSGVSDSGSVSPAARGGHRPVSVVKRLLVGRPLATTEQEHQRIPKTIALAVFSSDAISSTAYATEEILFVTAAAAGVEPHARPRHAHPDRDRGGAPALDRVVLVPPDDLRVPQRRRQLRRAAARTSARPRRWSRARRCSSTTSSPWRCRSRPASPRSSRSPRSTASSSTGSPLGLVLIAHHHARQPARHQGVGDALLVPDLPLHRHARRA